MNVLITSSFVTDYKEACQHKYKFVCIIGDMNEEFLTI